MRVFLDTNVVIDFCGQRAPFFDAAAEIIDMAKRGEIDLVISSLSFVNAAYVLRKQFERHTLDMKLCQLMDLCKVSKVDGDMIKAAINRQSYDFEDCVQFMSAKSRKADVVITRDQKSFADLDLYYMTADEFVRKCQE